MTLDELAVAIDRFTDEVAPYEREEALAEGADPVADNREMLMEHPQYIIEFLDDQIVCGADSEYERGLVERAKELLGEVKALMRERETAMGYINFKRQFVVVLNDIELMTVFNEYLRRNGEEPFGSEKFYDGVEYAFQTGFATPLANDQFKFWHIEPVGSIRRYSVEYILNGDEKLCAVPYDRGKVIADVLKQDYLLVRKYELTYVLAD